MSVSDANNKAIQPPAQALQAASNLAQAMTAAGLAATVGGAAGAAGACLALLGAILMMFDDTDKKIQQLQEEIVQLGLDARQQNILQRATDINTAMANCRVVKRIVDEKKNAGLKVPPDVADDLLRQVMVSLEALVPSDPGASLNEPTSMPLWFVLADYQQPLYFSAFKDKTVPGSFGAIFYYADLPYGEVDYINVVKLGPMHFSSYLCPPAEPAFCSTSTLPAYLAALTTFQAAGQGLRDNFLKVQEYRDEIKRHASFLADVYSKILGEGFIFLRLPTDPSNVDKGDWGDYDERWTNWKLAIPHCWYKGIAMPGPGVDLLPWQFPSSGYCQPFGCINRFTGNYVLDNFPEVPNSRLSPNDTPDKVHQLTMFYQGLVLAALRSGKQLYWAEQMEGIRSSVNSLCQLVGDPPLLSGRSFGDWSMREVFQIISNLTAALPHPPYPDGLPNLEGYDPPWTLRGLMHRLRQSCFAQNPLADDPGFRSIRSLLSWQ